MNKIEFINNYKRLFLLDDELKIRFKMGENRRGKSRITQVLNRFEEISNAVFSDKEVWVLLVIWDPNGKYGTEFVHTGFDTNLANDYYDGTIKDGLIVREKFAEDAFSDAKILYIRYENYSFRNIMPLVYSIAGYELTIENTGGILAYFISFEGEPVLLNLYDDRGMELLSHSKNLIDWATEKLGRYII